MLRAREESLGTCFREKVGQSIYGVQKATDAPTFLRRPKTQKVSSFNAFAPHQNLDKEPIPWGQINDTGSWESSFIMTARDSL